MKKRFFLVFLSILILLSLTLSASAQDYSFSLDAETVHVYWETDATLTLSYEFVFTCDEYAHPIDFVDVAMPNSSFNPSNASAKVNGINISHITWSSYVTNAVELGLGNNAIQPGETGTVSFQISDIDKEIYFDSTDENYASVVFSPQWFDGQFVHGNTDLTVVFHLPPSVGPDEGRYHKAPGGFSEEPYTSLDSNNRVTYAWNNPNAQGDKQYLFGASFPLEILPSGTVQTPTFWERIGIYPEDLFGYSMFCGVIFLIFGLPIISLVNQRKRKLKYLPPMLSLSSHGIKRGLTAIEAAILLEEPMDKILTMILFAVIKKNAAEVVTKDPLKLDVKDPLPMNLRKYEVAFLKSMKINSKSKRNTTMQKAMVSLVKSVQNKMKGFGKRDTVNYYKKVIEKAWQEVEASDTPEVRSDIYNKYLEWTMLDKDYSKKTETVFRNQPIFIPTWWRRYDPVYRSSPSSGTRVSKPTGPAPRPTPGGAGLPHLPGSDFAASVATGVQSFASGTIGNISDFTNKITNRTNPVPKSTSSSYRGGGSSGGGSSCACACACAGCACACAGGGR